MDRFKSWHSGYMDVHFFLSSLKISYAQHTGKTMIANMLMIKIAYLTQRQQTLIKKN